MTDASSRRRCRCAVDLRAVAAIRLRGPGRTGHAPHCIDPPDAPRGRGPGAPLRIASGGGNFGDGIGDSGARKRRRRRCQGDHGSKKPALRAGFRGDGARDSNPRPPGCDPALTTARPAARAVIRVAGAQTPCDARRRTAYSSASTPRARTAWTARRSAPSISGDSSPFLGGDAAAHTKPPQRRCIEDHSFRAMFRDARVCAKWAASLRQRSGRRCHRAAIGRWPSSHPPRPLQEKAPRLRGFL
jgi:hypothetical protein